MENIRRKYNIMIDLSKFISNKKILTKIVTLYYNFFFLKKNLKKRKKKKKEGSLHGVQRTPFLLFSRNFWCFKAE